MKNDEIRNSEFEETLKNKMDELASSVDCFDKISKRAFPEPNTEYSDSEFTICDLDNVTGKKNNFRFMSFAAIAAAFVLCLFFLPKNESFMNFLYSNIGIGSDKKAFRELISEIKEETADGSYIYYDCTLEEYIDNDILINPIYRCPFEQSEKDNLNVRIYVKTHNGVPTNQVYAIEYKGNYNDNNFVAAADSKAKFSDDDLLTIGEKIPKLTNSSYFNFPLSSNIFHNSNSSLFNEQGQRQSVGGFSYNCYYKVENEIYSLQNEIIYSENSTDENLCYFDICSVRVNSDNSSSDYSENIISQLQSSWNNIIYYDGNSAKSNGSQTRFIQADLDYSLNSDANTLPVSTVFCTTPFKYSSIETICADISNIKINVTDYATSELRSSVMPPLNPALRTSFRIYLGYSLSNLNVSCTDDLISSYVISVTESDYQEITNGYREDYSDENLLSIEQHEAEIEALIQAEENLKKEAEYQNYKAALEAEIDRKNALLETLNAAIQQTNIALSIETDEEKIKAIQEYNAYLNGQIELIQKSINDLEAELLTAE